MSKALHVATSGDGLPDRISGYRDWWSTDLRLWWRDFDSLGHLTASAYGVVYQEAFAGFVEQAWADPDPSFVVARMSIDYRREVRRDDSQVRVHVAVRRTGRASFETTMVLCSDGGRVFSTAETRNAAWDLERRCSRSLTEAEREGLLRHSVGTGGAPVVR